MQSEADIVSADMAKIRTDLDAGIMPSAAVIRTLVNDLDRASDTIDLRVEGAAEIAAASEALAKVEEHVRRALCGVLDRLGADGATAFMNGDSPEKLSDAIYWHAEELEDRARRSERGKTAGVLTKAIAMLKAGDEGGAEVVIEDEIDRLNGGTT